jgi:hypothetical protein
MAGNFITGYPASVETHNNYLPGQQNLISQSGQMGLKGLQSLSGGFAPIEAKSRRDFTQKTLPGIAERFTAMGGGQDSSAFGQQLGQAGADLETNLAALGSDYNQKQQDFYGRLMGMGLTQQLENFRSARQPGMLDALSASFPALAGNAGVGQGFSSYMGGNKNGGGRQDSQYDFGTGLNPLTDFGNQSQSMQQGVDQYSRQNTPLSYAMSLLRPQSGGGQQGGINPGQIMSLMSLFV